MVEEDRSMGSPEDRLHDALAGRPRTRLATLPTPLERGPALPGGARLWVKRDDLTGLGVGGNKARKLEWLCGQALADGADTLVTVGAGQSNHCRMTAAAGAVLRLPVHLVLGGRAPPEPTGNQLLSALFGAEAHFAGTEDWGELEVARGELTERLVAAGRAPASIPLGGSTPLGAVGFVAAFAELMAQCSALGLVPVAVVHTTSSGGTHAGLLAGRALWRAAGRPVPDVVAIGVAKGVVLAVADAAELARQTLALLDVTAPLPDDDAEVDGRWMGLDYGTPTDAADEAIRWAARQGAWVLDRVYTGKGFAGLLGHATDGRWGAGDDVVFWHTGGLPAVFAPGGTPELRPD
jgi:1-aminocyclopropane-1-carboxylate deaminase/D-cysteine desulfhydrase-like pyridoxal-dependent ACC family enzyme